MRIQEQKITVRELCEGYRNDDEEGVTGYGGALNIRPKYQREFVYDNDKRDEVIRTVMRGLPLNVMYWCRIRREDGSEGYEVMDGQQRTLSLCEYVAGRFSIDELYFGNQPDDIKERILGYELFVYVCDGTDSEKLEWFNIINIAGERLTDQEIRNATYAGPWTTEAKKLFSKRNCPAYRIGQDYLKGSPIRQDWLETALWWASAAEHPDVKNRDELVRMYMSEHQNDDDADALWEYFEKVMEWTRATFPMIRREMKGLPWGLYYNAHGNRTDLVPSVLEDRIQRLMGDEDVTKKTGIYEYLLTGDERRLSIRAFSNREKHEAYERQEHKCAICGKECDIDEMHGDHILPWSRGGKTVANNCQMLCRDCNLEKRDD